MNMEIFGEFMGGSSIHTHIYNYIYMLIEDIQYFMGIQLEREREREGERERDMNMV
jgi:translation initiation factor IF-2